MTEVVSLITYPPSHRNGYVLEASNQLQNIAIGGAIALVVGAILGPSGLFRAGVALGAAGLVGLAILAAFKE